MAGKGRRSARQRRNGAALLSEEVAYGREVASGARQTQYHADNRLVPNRQVHPKVRPQKTGVGCTVAALDYLDTRAKSRVKGGTSLRETATGSRRLPIAGEGPTTTRRVKVRSTL